MTRYNKTLAVVVPVSKVKALNTWLERQGYGPDNISQEASASLGSSTATHAMVSLPVDPEMEEVWLKGIAMFADEKTDAAVVDRETKATKVTALATLLTTKSLKAKPTAVETSR